MASLNIERDAKVMASDGEVGRVTHVVVSPETKEVTDLVVAGDHGERLVPMSEVASVDGDRVMLRGTRGQLSAAAFRRDAYHAVDEDEVRAETTRTARHGGAPLADADEDEVELAGRTRDSATREPRPSADERRAHDAGGPARLQLREERLKVSTEREQAGQVEIGKRVVEHTETVNVPVTEERVIIERHAGSGRVVDGSITETDETIEVPVMKERVVAEKETVVTDEVGVRKEVTERTERVSESVRKEELVVEGDREMIAPTKDGRPVDDHDRETPPRERAHNR